VVIVRRPDAERGSRIRDLRTLARRERGKEPVVSIMVARDLGDWGGDDDEDGRLERRVVARRWSEICLVVLILLNIVNGK